MSTEIQVLEAFFAAINRNDMAAMAEHLHLQVVRVEPGAETSAGTYRGAEAVRANVAQGRGTWAEGRCTPEGFHARAGKVVVFLHAWVRLHGATDWMGGRFADGFVFREGRIIEYRTFSERAQALRWAGIEGPAGPG